MTTLHDTINAAISSIQADLTALETQFNAEKQQLEEKFQADSAAVKASLAEHTSALVALGPWLEREALEAKGGLIGFFAKLGL